MKNSRGSGSVTVDHVAAHAGVSIKTVSRVLNNEANISARTRERVQASMAELKYHPNPSARRLASKRSDLIVLLYDDPNDSHLVQLQHGALDACRRSFHSLLLHPVDYRSPTLADDVLQLVRQRACAGLVLTAPVCDVPALVRALDASDVPFARLAPFTPSARGHAVRAPDRLAAQAMTAHLLGLGHRRIGFVRGHADHGVMHERLHGYRDALDDAGVAADESLIEAGSNTFESGVQAGRRLLARAARPSAIFASNDEMAAGVLYAAHALGIDVPAALSVAGCDDTPISRQTWPALSSVRLPAREMARAAVEQLVARGAPVPAARLDYALVPRESTALAAARRSSPPARTFADALDA
ncbi:LacI family DNA-binding transcriptional regulator [Bordetella genomosp. 5]|uniref:LacI family transcriptional regulator n=1 Tax=Bordetella genomosp. 5 TaxID=1395608 RepID=A0A261T897_9BORD|nr:LacI family DNA-binding transcriptional regulator [Bordetella genomosp. 5]OZI45838.1 LacI family transcriptional regulator [Bordetella genomosp. 5]